MAWTRLASSAASGSAQLQLEDAPDWRAGDKLVVASTDFDPNHAEVVTIASVSGATVTLVEAL
jgi:cell migration-inducing and hyaluronan-binding protein